MKRFIEGENRLQSTLFPKRLGDYIADDKPARMFVDELDLKELGPRRVPSSRRWTVALAITALALAAGSLGSCGLPLTPSHGPLPIRAIEEIYQEARALRDEIDVTRSCGST